MSKLEEQISSLLQEADIYYEREKTATDLRNGLLRFDFYLPEYNKLLEVNGQQHYYYNKHFFKNQSEFLKAQERDRIKINYSLANNYKLYIYPFFDMPKTANELFDKRYLATSKYHNDDVFRKFDLERKI